MVYYGTNYYIMGRNNHRYMVIAGHIQWLSEVLAVEEVSGSDWLDLVI